MSTLKGIEPAEPTEPMFEIQNLDRGATIEITTRGVLDERAWQDLEASLVRLIGVREPTLLRLDLSAVSERSTPSGDWRQAAEAAKAIGGVLVVARPAPTEQSGHHQVG